MTCRRVGCRFVDGIAELKLIIKEEFDKLIVINTIFNEDKLRVKKNILIRVGGLTMFLLFFCLSSARAYDFVDRSRGVKIYYTVISEENRTVEVAPGDEWERYEGNYTIPRVVRHNGKRYRVVAIGKRAFAGCDELRNITFSSNITRIDSAAFSHCESLTRLNLPPELKYLGDHAFAFCAFPYVKIPASVSHIGKGCFSYCQYVVDMLVDEENTITQMGADAVALSKRHRACLCMDAAVRLFPTW